jgi:hypothetical protein
VIIELPVTHGSGEANAIPESGAVPAV